MQYISSRGQAAYVQAAEAIKMGIAPDGGLFVPKAMPNLSEKVIETMFHQTYQERAAYILSLFLTDFNREEIDFCVNSAYNLKNFAQEKVAPLVKLNDKLHVLELWHGPTSAFKDMALQILPYLLTTSAAKTGEENEIVILVATSGDTGKAALAGFSDVDKTKIIVFYPADGVSEVQRRQMITQEGANVFVAAVRGNFDDAQSGVKEIFTDPALGAFLAKNNLKFSSANSINWGRLLPQIVYYVSAYLDLRANGDINPDQAINIVVPTGNFGNILAAYYAKRMGIPINKLICAANQNNVLTDFINSGIYDKNRSFEKTISPSMDILISSNLERLLFELTNHDSERVSTWMAELNGKGKYEIDENTHHIIRELFWSDYASDAETIATINQVWQGHGYLLDTHTAVAMNVYEKYIKSTRDDTVTVIASTASPFKFGSSVAQAIIPDKLGEEDEFGILNVLTKEVGISIPDGIRDLDKKNILHKKITEKDKLEATVLEFLGLDS